MADECTPGDWNAIRARLGELQGVVPSLADLPEAGPETALPLLHRMAEAIESLRRRGIKDQIQLESLQEITETLIRSRDADQVLATLASYLRQVLNLEEVLLLRRMTGRPSWCVFHAGLPAPGAHLCGEFPDALISPRLFAREGAGTGGGKPPADAARDLSKPAEPHDESLPERLDPARYRWVLPLGGAEPGCSAGSAADPLASAGWLCLTPAAGAPEDDSFRPAEFARRVEAILATLSHRDSMEREARYRRQLLQAMQDGLLAISGDGRIVEYNAAAARLLDLLAVGESPPAGALAKAAPALERYLQSVQRGESAPASLEMMLTNATGPVPIKVAASALRDERGEPAGVVVNLADLTEIREMEDEIRRLDRLAALGRFAA